MTERQTWTATDEAEVLIALEAEGALHREGTLLTSDVVRVRASSLTKERFDAAALRLYRRREISMHHHDHPMALPPGERDALVLAPGVGWEGEDVFFVGMRAR